MRIRGWHAGSPHRGIIAGNKGAWWSTRRKRMTTSTEASVWDTLDLTPSVRQRTFYRYLTATLVDLVVLNLFVEYWGDKVFVSSFTVSLLAAAVLQVLLKLTIALEHRVAAYYNAKPGGFAKFMRYFTAWLILFGSKFAILEALSFAFGENIRFSGAFHGIVALIVVVIAMLAVEVILVKLYRKMA
jgi:hypothetical protein